MYIIYCRPQCGVYSRSSILTIKYIPSLETTIASVHNKVHGDSDMYLACCMLHVFLMINIDKYVVVFISLKIYESQHQYTLGTRKIVLNSLTSVITLGSCSIELDPIYKYLFNLVRIYIQENKSTIIVLKTSACTCM